MGIVDITRCFGRDALYHVALFRFSLEQPSLVHGSLFVCAAQEGVAIVRLAPLFGASHLLDVHRLIQYVRYGLSCVLQCSYYTCSWLIAARCAAHFLSHSHQHAVYSKKDTLLFIPDGNGPIQTCAYSGYTYRDFTWGSRTSPLFCYLERCFPLGLITQENPAKNHGNHKIFHPVHNLIRVQIPSAAVRDLQYA